MLERLLPADWGLPRTALTAYRKAHLAKPEDWRYERQVILSASGAAKMRQHFGLDDAPVEAPVIKEGFVVRWDWRNSRMVEVRDDDGVKYIVRVNNAMKWRPDRQRNEATGNWRSRSKRALQHKSAMAAVNRRKKCRE